MIPIQINISDSAREAWYNLDKEKATIQALREYKAYRRMGGGSHG